MITRRLKTVLASVAVVLFLTNCRAQDSSGQNHNALTQLSESLQRVITKVTPAIVTVEVAGYVRSGDDGDDPDPARHDHYQVTKAHSLGSGVILDPNGYIITNAHVVDGARRLRVTLDEKLRGSHAHVVGSLNSTVFDARIIGVFEEADLALVKIDATGLPTVPIANSDTVQPGQLVFAVGSPEGFKNSVSMGVVSAVGRDSENGGGASFIQTDAAMNEGSSGGALVDANGDLVGITTFMVTEHGGNEGLGFALPSKLVQSIFDELRNTSHVAYGYIGVKVQSVTPTLARGLQIPQDWGIVVSDVVPGSSAESAGVRMQDLILALDGHPLASVPQFAAFFYRKRAGDQVQLELLRGSQRFTIKVTMVEHPADLEKPTDAAGLERGLVAKLGVVCIPVSTQAPSLAKALRSTSGVIVVAQVAGNDINAELMFGDVIDSVNGTAVTSVDALRSMMDKLVPGDSVVLQIERQRQFQYVPIDVD